MKEAKVTIIILTYNGYRDTVKCITDLLKTKYKHYEAIILDNGSTRNEMLLLKKKFKSRRLRFIRIEKNRGFAGGNNYILGMVKTKYVILLNNDAFVTPEWLQPLVTVMERNSKVAAAQPKIRWFMDKKYFDYAGACGGFMDILGYPFTRGRIFYTQEKDKGQYNERTSIVWASGAAIIMRMSVLRKIGFLDERFYTYMEEIDLCLRMLNQGYKIVSEPSSMIFHKVASTTGKNMSKKRYLEHRNNLLLLLKNYPKQLLIPVLLLRLLLLEHITAIHYLLKREPKLTLAVYKSFFAFLFLFPKYSLERKNYKISKNLQSHFYKGSIVLSYFILKKKTYDLLIKKRTFYITQKTVKFVYEKA